MREDEDAVVALFPHAILFLPGILHADEGGFRFESPGVSERVRVGLVGRFRAYAPKIAGQRLVFHVFPRTTPKGGLYSLQLARAYPDPPEGFAAGEGEVAGVVVVAKRDVLVIEVTPRPPRKPFRLTMVRSGPDRPRYQYGGGVVVRVAFEDGVLKEARSEPVAIRVPEAKSEGDLLAPPATVLPKRPSPDRPPDPVTSPPAVEDVTPSEGRDDLPELPPLPKGQYMGLVGEGPYYVIVKPQLADRWERIESALDRFPAPHRVLHYPDGVRAIECPDREALRVFYKSTFSLR